VANYPKELLVDTAFSDLKEKLPHLQRFHYGNISPQKPENIGST